ncbi:hypothetical protein, partial [Pseudoduganella buxea]|uniref:hypothetical protein n=1 Tax=Pseudoduganella buxea TaxID=1949069 RepID=UPI001B8C07E7
LDSRARLSAPEHAAAIFTGCIVPGRKLNAGETVHRDRVTAPNVKPSARQVRLAPASIISIARLRKRGFCMKCFRLGGRRRIRPAGLQSNFIFNYAILCAWGPLVH